MKTAPTFHQFTVEQYHWMGKSGFFPPSARVELIEGQIITMSPIGSRHAGLVDRLNHIFSRLLLDRVIVRIQNPIRLNNISEPEPDITLLVPRDDFYESRHPQPDDILLLIEVSDTTLVFDQEVKIPLYGAHGIRECWIVNINEQLIEVYQQPISNGYQVNQIVRIPNGNLVPLAFGDISLSVQQIFPF